MDRNTYAEVNLKNLESNIKEIIKKFDTYKYYFGIIKADSYRTWGYEYSRSND